MNKSFFTQSPFYKSPAYSQCLALESRMVFDGAIAATAVDVQNTANDQSATDNSSVATTVPDIPPAADFVPEKAPQTVDFAPAPASDNNQPNVTIPENPPNPIDTFAPNAITNHATTLIVIDPRADNATSLTANPPANTQVFVLDINRDGFQQIAEQLQSRHDVTQLDIIPWNKDSQQWLGTKPLTATLETSVTNNLMAWNDGLTNDARLVFHGQNDLGTAWDNYVSTLTGAQTRWASVTDLTPPVNSSPAPATIYFIDSAVQNSADIVSGLDANAEIVYLNANTDGLTQIADYLAGRSGVDNIQIISHGAEATLKLGNEILTNDNLTSRTDQLATIGHALTANGDILFYGCDLAKSTDGSKFIETFAYLTQADVAASTDLTGAANKGGNWTLEYTTGTIEASILAASHYQDILALPVFDVNSSTNLNPNKALLFNNPTVVPGTGTGLTVGSKIIFSNIVTINGQSIDAIVTIDDLSLGNASISALDSAAGTLGNPLNPNWFELDTVSNNPPGGGSATIKFDFILSGTYNPAIGDGTDVLLQNVTVNSYDIDNGQFQDFNGFSSFSVASNTTLLPTTPDGFTHFADTTNANNTANPNQPADPNGLPTFNQARVSAFYNEINAFQIKVGSTNNVVSFFYLDFSSGFNWIPPQVTHTVPDAVNDIQIGVAGSPVVINVLGNDVVHDGKPIPSGTVKIFGTASPGAPLTVTGEGTWSVDAGTGAITFTPLGSFKGDPTPIQYTFKDQEGLNSNIATVSIDYPPTALNDSAIGTVAGGLLQNVTIDVVANDTDPDGDKDPTSVKIVGTTNPGDSLVVVNEGTWLVNAVTGAITFQPLASFKGDPTPIQYTIDDLNPLTPTSNPATVTVDYPPIANNDTTPGTIIGGVLQPVLNIPILGNDTNNPVPGSVKIVGTTNPHDPLVVPGQGTWTVNPNGTINFVPQAGFTADPTPIKYTVTDPTNNISNQATVTIAYPRNPPVANPDKATGTPGVPTTVKVVTNDSDPDNNLDPKTVKIVGTTNPGDPLIVPGQGTWTVNPVTGDITFTPIPGFTGNPTPIQYTVKDTSNLESAPATVTITVNKLPVANPDTNTASVGGSPVIGDVLTNEFTLGDIPTQVTSASQGTNPVTIGAPFPTAGGGVLILNADGSYSYTPPKSVSATGLIEQFNYTITDANGDSSSSILTITVVPTGNSGSSILLNNPSLSFSDDRSIFFAPKPFAAVIFTDPRLYIPSPDGVLSLTGSVRNQVVLELKHFSFDIPSWAFRHTNPNAQLEFEATRPDGSALPEWLRFNPKLLRFSGIPPRGAHNEEVMITARDNFGHEVHAIFSVHVNRERVRPDHKSLSIDPKLLGLSKKVLEKHHKEKPVVRPAKSGLSEHMQSVGKMGKLQESRAILDSLKANQ